MNGSVDRAYEFGPYRLDVVARRLARDGHPVALSAQACDLLLALIEQSPTVVPHDAIERSVWPGEYVSPERLRIAIHRLRRTLDDEGESPRYVEAVAKQGYRFRPPVSVVDGSAIRSVRTRALVVLPLACDETADPDLAIGIADALMTRLPWLRHLVVRPIPAAAVVAKIRHDLSAAGALKVDLVLDGRLTVDGDAIDAALTLVSVSGNQVVWSQRFAGSVADSIALENTIAATVSAELSQIVSPSTPHPAPKTNGVSAEARRLYVRGVRLCQQRTPDSLRRGADAFAEATEKDPGYALAWAARADATVLSAYYLDRPTNDCLPFARGFAERALAIDGDLASASATLAHVLMRYDWEFERAETMYRRAIALNPASANAHQWFSLDLAALGRLDEALAENGVAQELDPLSPSHCAWRMWLWVLAGRPAEARQHFEAFGAQLAAHPSAQVYLGWAHILEERWADAERAFETVQKMGGGPIALGSLGYIYGVTGRRDEALAVRDRLTARASYVQPDVDLPVHAGLGDEDATLTCLERCCDERTYNAITTGVNPALAGLRHLPRYQAVIKRLGLQQQS